MNNPVLEPAMPTMADLRQVLTHRPISNLEGYLDFTIKVAALSPSRETWAQCGAWLKQLFVIPGLTEAETDLLADICGECFPGTLADDQ